MAHVVISPDAMRAELVLEPGERLGREAATALIESAGVRPDGRAFADLERSRGPARVIIAIGRPPSPGSSAEIRYEFLGGPDLSSWVRGAEPQIGRSLVAQGDVLARLTPARPGAPGLDVFGRLIPAPQGMPAELAAGAGAAFSPDGLMVVASRPGTPRLEGRSVTVRPRHLISGDASSPTGSMSVEGDLEITGGIRPQMEVAATGDVIVRGSVVEARVTAGGNIVVLGAVRRESILHASHDVYGRLVERSAVRCAGTLYVGEDVLDSEVVVGGSLIAGGSLVGGKAVLGDHGEVRSLGSRQGVPTALVVAQRGAPPPEIEAIEEERSHLRTQLERISPWVRQARAAMASASGTPNLEVFRKAVELAAQLQSRDAELESRLSALGDSRLRVEVREAIHPNVSIQIGRSLLEVDRPLSAGTLTGAAGRVSWQPAS